MLHPGGPGRVVAGRGANERVGPFEGPLGMAELVAHLELSGLAHARAQAEPFDVLQAHGHAPLGEGQPADEDGQRLAPTGVEAVDEPRRGGQVEGGAELPLGPVLEGDPGPVVELGRVAEVFPGHAGEARVVERPGADTGVNQGLLPEVEADRQLLVLAGRPLSALEPGEGLRHSPRR